MIAVIRGLLFACLSVAPLLTPIAVSLEQPMRPERGYGSEEHYLCHQDCAIRTTLEPLESPDRVSYYLPKVLKNGDSAPVIVYLHGFFAPVPEIYQDHINHLTKQGYIVIFPQYQAGNWGMVKELGIFATADQSEWLKRAVAATHRVLDILGEVAERHEIYGFGHSIGGLLLMGWEKVGGTPMKAMVLANPKLNLKSGMPEFVRKMIRVKELPWTTMADAITARVVVLGGSDDKIAPHDEYSVIKQYATNARSFAFYLAQSDKYSPEVIKADHMAPMTNGGFLKYLHWMLNMMDSSITLNTYDFRYYYAAFDALLHGESDFSPELGSWSDGHPFGGIARVL